MRVGMPLPYGGDLHETVGQVRQYEEAGLDVIFVPESYSFDSVSQLGFLAASTTKLEIASSILNIYSRTPTLLAMTAAGLDYVSAGRFTLGVGASGPQVVEGFHGVKYDAPIARTREVASICRSVWRREKLVHDGDYYTLPLGEDQGASGLGKPLKLINRPVRERIPIVLAALGPKNVALAAELFEGWQPVFYYPEKAQLAFGDALDEGTARRDPSLGPLQVFADTHLAITDDAQEAADAAQRVREHLALYVGGMGSKGKNFYNELARRYGFEEAADEVQEHYLAGRRLEAAAAVPQAFVDGVSLIGASGWVKERVAVFASAGVTTLNAVPLAPTHEQRVRDIAQLQQLCS